MGSRMSQSGVANQLPGDVQAPPAPVAAVLPAMVQPFENPMEPPVRRNPPPLPPVPPLSVPARLSPIHTPEKFAVPFSPL